MRGTVWQRECFQSSTSRWCVLHGAHGVRVNAKLNGLPQPRLGKRHQLLSLITRIRRAYYIHSSNVAASFIRCQRRIEWKVACTPIDISHHQ